MLVPISWLKEFVNVLEEPKELSKRLTMSGSNVEGIKHWGEDIKNIVSVSSKGGKASRCE